MSQLFPAHAGVIQKRNGWGGQNIFSDILRILFFLRKAKAATLFIQSNQVTAFCMCEILMIYSDVLRFFLKLGLDIGEAFQQKGIECAAFPVQDHPHGGLVGERLFVAALTGQGVVHIGQGDDLRADGDVIALEAVRVAPAIPALMVPAGDVVGGLQQGFILKVFQPPQHVGTLHTVGLDDLELLFTRNRFRLLCNNFLRGGGKWAKDCNKIKNLV